MKKAFLDDMRPCPDGWYACRWPEEVIELLSNRQVEQLSLDHDLGEEHGYCMPVPRTGMDVLNWLEELAFSLNDPAEFAKFLPPGGIIVHSANAAKVPVMKKIISHLFILAGKEEKK